MSDETPQGAPQAEPEVTVAEGQTPEATPNGPEPASASAPPSTPGPPLLTYVFAAAAVVFLIISGWLTASLTGLRRQVAEDIDQERQRGLIWAAEAAAASLEPTMNLKGQVPEITDRTLQSVCQALLANDQYSFVAITDPSGSILASSDLAQIGKHLEGFELGKTKAMKVGHEWQVIAPVPRGTGALGALALRRRG